MFGGGEDDSSITFYHISARAGKWSYLRALHKVRLSNERKNRGEDFHSPECIRGAGEMALWRGTCCTVMRI